MEENVKEHAEGGPPSRRGGTPSRTSASQETDPEDGTPEEAAPTQDDPAPAPAPSIGAAPVLASKPLGELLLERDLVTQEQLAQAMDRHKRTRRRLGRVLVEMGFATAEGVLEALSGQLGVQSTRVNSYTVNPEAVQCLPEKVARKHTAFPLLKVGSTLVVAIASPKDLHALDDLRFASGVRH